MRNLILLLHLAAAILWLGGMAFLLFALRPALHARLEPPQRLPLVVAVLRRFFVVVSASIVVLLATGVPLLRQLPAAEAPAGWHAMAGLGLVMVLVFGHIYFAGWPRLQRAVTDGRWPDGGRALQGMTRLVQLNLALGGLAIAAVRLWR